MIRRLFAASEEAHDSRPFQLAAAVDDQLAVIWFNPDGTVIEANKNFCDFMGYKLEEIAGQHHRIFCEEKYTSTQAYKDLWADLRRGKKFDAILPRKTKSGKRVYIRGSYYPILDQDGKVEAVVKFASDVTEATEQARESQGKIKAIEKSQAVIEFKPDGTILTANDLFQAATGYTLAEIQGKHHRMFMMPDDARTGEYAQFWQDLAAGQYKQGNFVRRRKDGSRMDLSATYSPITNSSGEVVKVIKFAHDVTEQLRLSNDLTRQREALGKTNAIIEFELDGTIIKANQAFLDTTGYALEDIVGQKHAMFVTPELRSSQEYKNFWDLLGNGTYQEGEFKRLRKSGEEFWILGSYNPITDMDGKPYKVVKFCQDITGRKFAIDSLVNGLQALAKGDLTIELEQELIGEFEKLRQDFNSSMAQLRSVLGEVVTSGTEVKTEIDSISASAADLSRRTERQASNVAETAAAMEELAASVENAASSAQEARQRVSQSNSLATEGGEIVASTVSAMSDISESSEQVSKIISVIDDIAFQTNLLALNAGVEAARAGESGRGFAVVASEVRGLAQRSSDAAREIAELISLSSRQVSKGVELVGRTGQSLTDIGKSVSDVLEQVEVIATIADEQNRAITEINAAVSNIDSATQKNTAMFEEVTAATQSVTKTADDLIRSTDVFTIDGLEPAPSAAPPAPEAKQAPAQPAKRPPAPAPRNPAPRTEGSAALAVEPETEVEDDWEDF